MSDWSTVGEGGLLVAILLVFILASSHHVFPSHLDAPALATFTFSDPVSGFGIRVSEFGIRDSGVGFGLLGPEFSGSGV